MFCRLWCRSAGGVRKCTLYHFTETVVWPRKVKITQMLIKLNLLSESFCLRYRSSHHWLHISPIRSIPVFPPPVDDDKSFRYVLFSCTAPEQNHLPFVREWMMKMEKFAIKNLLGIDNFVHKCTRTLFEIYRLMCIPTAFVRLCTNVYRFLAWVYNYNKERQTWSPGEGGELGWLRWKCKAYFSMYFIFKRRMGLQN